jgi:hypothetical protein
MVMTVNKTGANINQKSHGHMGGKLFVVGSDQRGIRPPGAATDNYLTVVIFTAATDEPIMIAMILKSDKT